MSKKTCEKKSIKESKKKKKKKKKNFQPICVRQLWNKHVTFEVENVNFGSAVLSETEQETAHESEARRWRQFPVTLRKK